MTDYILREDGFVLYSKAEQIADFIKCYRAEVEKMRLRPMTEQRKVWFELYDKNPDRSPIAMDKEVAQILKDRATQAS